MSGKNFLKLHDLVTFSLMDQNLVKVKDDYEGAFKPPANPGATHPSGMGTVAGQGTDGQPPAAQAGTGLQVRIAATHAGIITRNNGFYIPDKMKKGAATFTDGYPKPVLLHHQEHTDPVGRVIESKYVDTSGSIQDRFIKNGLVVKDRHGAEKGVITDVLMKDFIGGKMPFGMQVEVVCNLLRDSLLEDTGYDGLGHIQVVANVTDKNTIEKLLDGRYLTGSVGATTDRAVCSICRQDWTDDGKCEHKPGAVYDGAKCFIIAGNLVYDEYSFVNVPADRHSKVLELHYNGVKDNVKIANDFHGRIYEVRLGFPQYDSVTKEDTDMPVKTGAPESETGGVKIEDKTARFDPRAKEEGDGQSKGGADAEGTKTQKQKKPPKLKKDSDQHEDDCECDECLAKKEDKNITGKKFPMAPPGGVPKDLPKEPGAGEKKKAKKKKDSDEHEGDCECEICDAAKAAASGLGKVDPRGLDPRAKKGAGKAAKKKKDSEEHEDDCECDECEAKKADAAAPIDPKGIDPRAKKGKKVKKKDQAEFDALLDKILANVDVTEADLDELYELMADEIDDAIADGELDAKLEDAKLSTEKRKKLAKSTFCGPGKSFPVPDCAHVTAARRLIGRYKGGGSKESILSCVSRKAKALGCGGSDSKKKDEVVNTQTQQVTTETKDKMQHARVLRILLAALEEDKFYNQDEQVLTEEETKDLQTILKRMAGLVGQDNFVGALSAESLAMSPECEKALLDEVVKAEDQVGSLREEVDALRKEYNHLFQDMEALTDALTEANVNTRKVREEHVSTLMTLKDGKVDKEALVKLTDEVLTAEQKRLSSEVDMAKIVDKLGNGMSREPTGTVDDPNVIRDDKQVNQKREMSIQDLATVQESIYKVLFSQGQAAAQAYVKRLQMEGKLPQDTETK